MVLIQPGPLPEILRLKLNSLFNRIFRPESSIDPDDNGDLAIQATSNTELTFKYKGDDGVIRSGSVTLS